MGEPTYPLISNYFTSLVPSNLAPIEKRQVAIETLFQEWPDIAWVVIIKLLPNQLMSSSGSHKPAWRKQITDNFKSEVSPGDYWLQILYYAELAVANAGHDMQKLAELVGNFDKLPQPAFDQLCDVLLSPAIIELSEEQRLLLWNKLTAFIEIHRRFSDAKWSLPKDLFKRIKDIAKKLAPHNPFYLYQSIFSENDSDFYGKSTDYQAQQLKLDERRVTAIKKILQQGSIEEVIKFAESVSSPYKVGWALGGIADPSIEQALLPSLLDPEKTNHSELVVYFILQRKNIGGWKWVDTLDRTSWTTAQARYFLNYLPFEKGTWERASQWLGDKQGEYWMHTQALAGSGGADLDIAIDKLIEYGRPYTAIRCFYWILYKKQPIRIEQAILALQNAISSTEKYSRDRDYNIIELIKYLQVDASVPPEDLSNIEFAYLELLNGYHEATPKTLINLLANNPKFFCEVIRHMYRSNKEKEPHKEPSEKTRAIASNMSQLLREWKTPPGMLADDKFDPVKFNDWLQQVKDDCTKSGHLDVALIHIGKILIHAPADPDGLWINRTIAQILNDPAADDMRNGYSTGIFNARGAHFVDSTRKLEKDLAEQFRKKAEAVENAGYWRFAETLKQIAKSF